MRLASELKGEWHGRRRAALADPPTHEVAVHVRDYERFTHLMKWGAIASLITARRRFDPLADHRRMKIAVLKERPGRDALRGDPETVKKFIGLGAAVAVERARAGRARSRTRSSKRLAQRSASRARRSDADIILCVEGPSRESLKGAKKARCWSGRSTRSRARRSAIMPRRASRRWRWNGCRGSPAPSRWTSCPRSRTSPATRR